MTSTIKAIDTRYAGHLFRSRLEARWAVFFDHLGIPWQYESEGFQLPDGTHYLPDFLLQTPQGERRWVEVKPSHITTDPKFTAFEKAILGPDGEWGHRIYPVLVSGSPHEWLQAGNTFCPRCGMPVADRFDWSGADWYLLCYPCDWETPCGGGHSPEPTGVGGIEWFPHKGHLCLEDDPMKHWGRAIWTAAVVAQEARFEHGCSGPTLQPST